jgi:hypothetical protein
MTIVELVEMIGDALTLFDTVLANPNFPPSDPQWQQVYALRKHLDDLQRQLVTAEIDVSTAQYQLATEQLKTADKDLKAIGTDITKVASLISIASTVASGVDHVFSLAK